MFRVALFALAIGVTLYALLDWWFTSKNQTPGNLSRWIWLAVIILLPILGPTTWVVLRVVGKTEERQRSAGHTPMAPDDDTEFLTELAEKIRLRKRKSTEGPQDD